jgi:hypothetical protein
MILLGNSVLEGSFWSFEHYEMLFEPKVVSLHKEHDEFIFFYG